MSNNVETGSGLPGLPRRFVQVFVSPGVLFRALREDPRALWALVLGAVLAAIGNGFLPQEIYEPIIRQQLANAGSEIPADLSTTTLIAKWGGVIGVLILWPLIGLAVAGFYTLLFRLALGYEGRFKQYLAVTAHVLLIGAVGSLALTPARIMAQNPQMTLTLGALAPGLENGFLAGVLRYLDFFNLWGAILVGYAASILDGKRSAGSSVTYSLLASVLLAVLIATVFG